MVMVECSLRSLRTVDSHVVFGLPVGRFTGLMKCQRDCLADVSGGHLIRWLNQESLLFIIMTLQGFMWVRFHGSITQFYICLVCAARFPHCQDMAS